MNPGQSERERLLLDTRHDWKYRRTLTLTIGSALVACAWLAYSILQVSSLGQEASKLRQEIADSTKEIADSTKEYEELKAKIENVKGIVNQSANADFHRASLLTKGNPDERSKIRIQYFAKDAEEKKIESALLELGFQPDKRQSLLQTTFTNAIWFGSDVKIEYVKLVAYTLIRNGIEIRDIRPFLNSSGRETLVQIGGRVAAADKPVWTVERIEAATEFPR